MWKILKGPNKTSRDENYNVWDKNNILDGINVRLETAKEKNSEFENIAIKIIQMQHREKKIYF